MEVFKHLLAKAKPLRYTPSQLEELITSAQNADKQAILALCIAFTPLILREAHYPRIKDSLKEDAVNIAWEIFLKFIYKYNGNDYRHLPGLVQCHLRYELLHKISRQVSIQNCDSLNITNTDGESLQIADEQNAIELFENHQLLTSALKYLTARQKQVILAVHFKGYSLQEYSRLQGKSYKTFYLHYQRAIVKLQKLIL